MKKRIFSACLLASVTACDKKDAKPTIDFGPHDGITQRDASNRLYGTIDTTDWTADETWTKEEQKLFTVPFNLNAPFPLRIQPREFFPNPTTTKKGAYGFYGIPNGATWSMVFVDKNYKVVEKLEYGPFSVSEVLFGFDFPADKFQPNTTYRVYYLIYQKAPAILYLKGHGDIKIGS
ncbi:hypothetical protein HMJ29_03705 [Hymenobacter taeanensis]|uniref:Lipoprotein n=1 Tax=Hymenobacter taeanensis TaxID=2735321 RepID=A0A6M6BDP5_9BACT|nr:MULTISPECIES: hypothetical protein [Hymenobacter]QJX46092.1 hypothetical protein HMJ29_03705 [Hymenobacter taeanensis]UOQ79946.1 hypothetical protein MUN83_13960 [Hymenobacter sp. 5414T-23]